MTVYRKRGSSVRYENGVVVRIEECGEAREVGAELLIEPIGNGGRMVDEDGEARELRVRARAAAIVGAAAGVHVERLVVSEGVSSHEYGELRWEERAQRVHLSLTHHAQRALLDFEDADCEVITQVAHALRELRDAPAPAHLLLEPQVTAALLPSLIGLLALEQAGDGVDGYGRAIETRAVAGEPPNCYRPSYRLRPIRAWHHLRALPFGTLTAAPRAIALLAPPDHTSVRLLCVDGHHAFSAAVAITAIRAVGAPVRWFPYAAGAFGARMLL